MEYIKIHKKWDRYWKENNTNKFDPDSKKPKYYCLEMFPYPSGANLHLGHYFNFALADTHARYKRMTGYNVFQPFGFDAFGLPAENYALKTGTHPRDNTIKNIEKMKSQIEEIGYMSDWDYAVTTCYPDYYKWTQWLFIQLFNKGLAYQKNAPVNWCTKCNTVLANEQVHDGACERCSSPVIRKQMNQWFFKITDYAEKLLTDLDSIDWPEKTKIMQRNWIGKSTGSRVSFDELEVFTTRIDTIFGVTFMVIAPEHPLAQKYITSDNAAACQKYIEDAAKKSDIERLGSCGEKTGVFTGSTVTNPANGKKIPVYLGDYVLSTYGTGAIMAVPAHDERDYAFAQKYNLPIIEVIESEKPLSCDDGILINSGKYTGMTSAQARKQITKDIPSAKSETTYRLRDWGIGRQRYWGCPIPIVYCDKCGTVAETRLPVVLPIIHDFSPKGAAPLASHPEFYKCTCPKCGGEARRECDTMDTFVCSSWYFLRYPDARNEDEPFSKDNANKMLPVDKYIGGAEHACMHLLYARFITKFLNDQGFISFSEPFKSVVHQGMILGTDGQKMSKSKGNTKEPDDYTSRYGSDILRLFMLFGFNYIEGGPWNDDTLKTVTRFTERIENIIKQIVDTPPDAEVLYVMHNSIKHVREDLESFSFNTAVARCMELLNALSRAEKVSRVAVETLVLLLAPMIPHIAEQYWEMLGKSASIFDVAYPEVNEKYLVRDEVEIVVQINSKIVNRINIPNGASQTDVEKIAIAHVDKLKNQTIKKIIYIPNKLINYIV